MKKVLSINVVMFNSIFGLRNKLGIKGHNSSKQPKTTFDKRAGNKFNKEIVDRQATITENMHKFNGNIEERLGYSADMYDNADRHPYVVSGISIDKGEVTGYRCATYREDQTKIADSIQNMKKEYKMILKHPHLKSGDSIEGYVMDYKLELEVGVVLEQISDVFEICEYKEKNVEDFLKEVGNIKPIMSNEEVSKELVDYAQKIVSLFNGK